MRSIFMLALAACSSTESPTDAGGLDASPDASYADAAHDAADEEAAVADAGNVYSAFGDTSKWSSFDVVAVGGTGCQGGAFDGRYVYLAPSGKPQNKASGMFLRYDTMGAFETSGAWEAFNLATKDSSLVGFAGAVFDGTYVDLVPFSNATFARFKVGQTFKDANAYETVDLVATVGADAQHFAPAPFHDGKLYFAPCPPPPGGDIVRYDVGAPLDASTSYETKLINFICMVTAVTDGTYVYFIPEHGPNGATGPSGNVFRYDESQPLTDFGSYLSVDTQGSVGGAGTRQYGGGVFDGRYVYLVPGDGAGNPGDGVGSIVVRYDTKAAFNPTSFKTYDLAAVSSSAHGFKGGTFDGRYVYFAPNATTLAVRYDTTQPFDQASSWETFTLAQNGYWGMVFDGARVFYVPHATSVAVSFRARSQAALPAIPSSFL